MSYHPLMGITIFFVFLIVAFFLGQRQTVKKDNKYLVLLKNKKKPIKSDSISPDANWID